jgi:hypothetical protein
MQVYKAIFHNAPCTSAEAMEGFLDSENVLSQSRARFTELRELGVIYERGTRKCKVTGRNVIEWDLTDNLPKDIEPKSNRKKERTDKALNGLRNLYKNKESLVKWQEVAELIKKI